MPALLHNWKEKILFACNAVSTYLFFKKIHPQIKPNHILVVKIDEIGDMVCASPVFESLKKKFPHAEITLLCKPASQHLIMHSPYIDKVITSLSAWNKRYDLHIELRGTWQTLLRGFRYKPTFRLDRGTVRFRNKKKGGFLTDRQTNEAIIRPLMGPDFVFPQPSLFASESDVFFVEKWIEKHTCKPIAVFHATANKSLKEWPAERFLTLAKELYDTYGLIPVFIGGKEEFSRVESLVSALTIPSFNVAGVFSLTQLYCFFKHARVYVGNDSGPMHIASVAGLPLVGLFGPGPAAVFYPEGPHVRILHHVLPCNPCDQIHCVRPSDTCMQQISVADVNSQIKSLITFTDAG